MVSLATVYTPYFSVSPIELSRPGRSYSVETLREFRKLYGDESTIYFIMGVDAFLDIATWKEGIRARDQRRRVSTTRAGSPCGAAPSRRRSDRVTPCGGHRSRPCRGSGPARSPARPGQVHRVEPGSCRVRRRRAP